MDNGQNQGPVFGSCIPVDGIVLEERVVQIAEIGAQEGIDDVGKNNGRDHGGEADDGLNCLGGGALGDFRHADCNEQGNHKTEENPDNVV